MRHPVLPAPALLAALALTVIPSHRPAAAAEPVATTSPAAVPAAPATTSAAPAGATTKAALPLAVPFIEDDYDRALAEARRRGVPLFIDAWAPW